MFFRSEANRSVLHATSRKIRKEGRYFLFLLFHKKKRSSKKCPCVIREGGGGGRGRKKEFLPPSPLGCVACQIALNFLVREKGHGKGEANPSCALTTVSILARPSPPVLKALKCIRKMPQQAEESSGYLANLILNFCNPRLGEKPRRD